MDFAAFLDEIRSSPSYRGQIVYYARQEPRAARYSQIEPPLTLPGQCVLSGLGVEQLYIHQAQGLEAVRRGEDVLLATGTASGKSLVYQLAILELLERNPHARVLMMFPLKALAQDQLLSLQRLLKLAGREGILCGCYDGDTPAPMRRKLRDEGRVILTNPDMLHAGLMPQHTRWAEFLENLELVVLDEMHIYSGLFGANIANFFRRFARVLGHYGKDVSPRGAGRPGRPDCASETAAPTRSAPQFIFSSATIGNPAELVGLLTGRKPTVIDDDGSPAGARHWVFWNPPVIYGRKYRARRSANVEATELMAELVRRGVPSITFSKAKITAELIYRYVSDNLRETSPEKMSKVMPYRGGYLPEERREIERKLFTGELLGVSCTRALELGIDIGGLDASIVVGYPGTLASFFQQAGRAGRRDRESLVVLVGLDTSINQYVMQNPDYIFGRPIEEVVLDRDNPFIIAGHLRCAAHELPVAAPEAAEFGVAAPEALKVLQDMRKVRLRAERWYHATAETPQHEMSLRGTCEAELIVQDSDTKAVIGHMNLFDGPTYVHPKAIYMHYGDTYFVDELDLIRRIAWVHRVDVDYYTQPMGGTDIHHIDRMLRRKVFGPATACFGEVTAYFQTHEFERIHFYKLDAFTREAVDPKLPTLQLETMGMWFTPEDDLLREVIRKGLDPYSGLRGIGYGLRMLLPLFVTCETLDFSHTVGCTNSPWQSTFIYERYPLGLGFTERAYERLHEILPALLERIKTCKCREGCPCCVGKPLRGDATWNVERHEGSVPSKKSARMILELMLADKTLLNLPDEDSLGQDEEEARLRLERSLRRRLERQAFPDILHDIEARPPEGYPEPEAPPQSLSDTDVARRAIRRREHESVRRDEAYREGQRREAVKAEGMANLRKQLDRRTAPPATSPVGTPDTPAGPVAEEPDKSVGRTGEGKVLGDAVAAAALKKKRQKKSE